MKVKIVNRSQWPLPQYATPQSAGVDLRADVPDGIVLPPLGRAMVPTGLYLEIPVGYEAQVRPRSGLAAKKGVTVLNSPGTIDADYRGERIAQMVIARHEHVEWEEVEVLEESERGAGGFGSTGVK